jgi:hypothetical protein
LYGFSGCCKNLIELCHKYHFMRHFFIEFSFEGQVHTAEVSEAVGPEQLRYLVTLENTELRGKYGNLTVHRSISDKSWQFALPQVDHSTLITSVINGLYQHLEGTSVSVE